MDIVSLVSTAESGRQALQQVVAAARKRRLKNLYEAYSERRRTDDEQTQLLRLDAEQVLMVANRYLEDDEAEKAWAYGALMDAFADEKISDEDEVRYLRCIRELTQNQLLDLRQILDAFITNYRRYLKKENFNEKYQQELDKARAAHDDERLQHLAQIPDEPFDSRTKNLDRVAESARQNAPGVIQILKTRGFWDDKAPGFFVWIGTDLPTLYEILSGEEIEVPIGNNPDVDPELLEWELF